LTSASRHKRKKGKRGCKGHGGSCFLEPEEGHTRPIRAGGGCERKRKKVRIRRREGKKKGEEGHGVNLRKKKPEHAGLSRKGKNGRRTPITTPTIREQREKRKKG